MRNFWYKATGVLKSGIIQVYQTQSKGQHEAFILNAAGGGFGAAGGGCGAFKIVVVTLQTTFLWLHSGQSDFIRY